MDHKRGYYLLDQPKQATDHAARKRQKDLSHPSSSSSPLFQLEGPSSDLALRANGTNSEVRAMVMNKDELESYISPSMTSHEMDKTVEDNAYKRLLPVLKKVRMTSISRLLQFL